MATTPKILGQALPTNTSVTDLYTVPSATSATVSSVVVCNLSTSTRLFRISVAVAGAADASKQYLYWDVAIEPNDTFIATIGATLAATDKVRCRTNSASDLAFNCFGIEKT